jgi:hypothetical protein
MFDSMDMSPWTSSRKPLSFRRSICGVGGKHELCQTLSNGHSLNSKLISYPDNPEKKGDDRTIS